jgi:hypothetical protein
MHFVDVYTCICSPLEVMFPFFTYRVVRVMPRVSSSVIRFIFRVVYIGFFDSLSHSGEGVGWQNHLASLCKLLGSACRLMV